MPGVSEGFFRGTVPVESVASVQGLAESGDHLLKDFVVGALDGVVSVDQDLRLGKTVVVIDFLWWVVLSDWFVRFDCCVSRVRVEVLRGLVGLGGHRVPFLVDLLCCGLRGGS